MYVIGSEHGVILKRVRRGSDAEHITLVSENTDYAPFELSLSKVHSIALVGGCRKGRISPPPLEG